VRGQINDIMSINYLGLLWNNNLEDKKINPSLRVCKLRKYVLNLIANKSTHYFVTIINYPNVCNTFVLIGSWLTHLYCVILIFSSMTIPWI